MPCAFTLSSEPLTPVLNLFYSEGLWGGESRDRGSVLLSPACAPLEVKLVVFSFPAGGPSSPWLNQFSIQHAFSVIDFTRHAIEMTPHPHPLLLQYPYEV